MRNGAVSLEGEESGPHKGEAETEPARPAMRPGPRSGTAEPEAETTPQGQERRHFQRVELETEVTFESEDNFYAGFSEDISEGGLFVATYKLQPIGTAVEVTFTLPNGHIVKTTGQVRWVRDPRDESPNAPPGMGIQFGELPPEDRDAIYTFIRARSPLFYDE